MPLTATAWTAGRESGAGAAGPEAGAALGAADGAADGAAGAGLAAAGAAGAAEGGGEGSRTVGAAVGFGGRAIRTVSFLGWTLAASPGVGGTGELGAFSDISDVRT